MPSLRFIVDLKRAILLFIIFGTVPMAYLDVILVVIDLSLTQELIIYRHSCYLSHLLNLNRLLLVCGSTVNILSTVFFVT
jgi:hypothetical protein